MTFESTEQKFRAVELHLRENPQGLTSKELARKSLYSHCTVNRWLRLMEKQGRVVRPEIRTGTWTLPEPPKDSQ